MAFQACAWAKPCMVPFEARICLARTTANVTKQKHVSLSWIPSCLKPSKYATQDPMIASSSGLCSRSFASVFGTALHFSLWVLGEWWSGALGAVVRPPPHRPTALSNLAPPKGRHSGRQRAKLSSRRCVHDRVHERLHVWLHV